MLIPEAHANVFFIRLHLKYSTRAAVIFSELPSTRLMIKEVAQGSSLMVFGVRIGPLASLLQFYLLLRVEIGVFLLVSSIFDVIVLDSSFISLPLVGLVRVQLWRHL